MVFSNLLGNFISNLTGKFIFNLQEIKNNKYLQVLYFVIVTDLLFLLQEWYKVPILLKDSVKNINYLCPPYFYNCSFAYIFTDKAPSYSYQILLTCVLVFIFLSVFCFFKKSYQLAALLLLPPFIFKLLILYFLNYDTILNYNYLTLLIAFIFIFAKDKLFSIKVTVTFMYFSSAIIKVYPSYLAGNFFNALIGGLPLLPEGFNSLYACIVIVMLILGPILLWSKNKLYKLASFVVMLTFHFYSTIFVGLRFPFLCIMLLYVFYLSEYDKFELKKVYTNRLLALLLLIMLALQSLSYLIDGNHRYTAEGEKYGYYIFNTNKQCITLATVNYKDGTNKYINASSTNPIQRCDPYRNWFIFNKMCEASQNINNIKWLYYVSLNGSYYHKVVDTEDICKLKYFPFKHNEWIKDDVIDFTIPVTKNSL